VEETIAVTTQTQLLSGMTRRMLHQQGQQTMAVTMADQYCQSNVSTFNAV
jgi:hypothetical protein